METGGTSVSRVEEILRFDRTVLEVTTLEQAAEDDKRYWMNATPEERLAALEATRRSNFGYAPDECHLPRTLEVVECPWG